MNTIKLQRGFTLVELIIAIVVISIGTISVMGLLASQASHSGEAMIRDQAAHIASAYLNEVLQKSFNDPDGINEVGRSNFDDVRDYNNLVDVGAKDPQGNLIAGLNQFTVSVTVTTVAFNAITVASDECRQVIVTVRHSNGMIVTLSGYRMRYP